MKDYLRYLIAAALNQINIVAFSFLTMISLISGNFIPFLIAAGMEACWVIGAPLVPAFRASVDRRHERNKLLKGQADRESKLKALGHESRKKYQELERIVESVRQSSASSEGTGAFVNTQFAARLDEMLGRYLATLAAFEVYSKSISQVAEENIESKLKALNASDSSDERLREVQSQRRDILEKRLERYRQARKDAALLQSQLETFEDLVKLMKEQSQTMRDPTELTGHVDSMLHEIEVTEQTVAELESSFAVIFDRELEKEEQKRLTK